MLDAAEGERFQGVANNVFFQVKGVVVLAAIDERQMNGEVTIIASIEYRRKNRADSRGKTGATPYFLFSENRELYRLFRPIGWDLIIGSCPPFFRRITMATAAYKKGKLYDLPIIDLNQDPNQPRKSMDPQALEELTASIKTHGIIQPLLFRVDSDSSNLIIVAGERRYKAAQQAGLLTLPGICVEGNPSEIALVENLLRQDLTAIEEAEGLQSLMSEQKYRRSTICLHAKR